MSEVTVTEELWRSAVDPEGILERWRVEDGAVVSKGQPLADLRIEDALHELIAPHAGRLSILTGRGSIIGPGEIVCRLDQAEG